MTKKGIEMKKNVMMGLAILVAGVFSLTAKASDWETDFAKASTEATKTGAYMLLDFSGSDWCGWCIKLDKEVFSKDEFKQYAKDHLICVSVDFPRKKEQSQELKDQNAKLAAKYGIQGYPTVIILAPDGSLAGQTGYQPGGPAKYVAHVKGIIADYEKQHPKEVKKD